MRSWKAKNFFYAKGYLCICTYLIIFSDRRVIAFIDQLKYAHIFLRFALLTWMSVHCPYYEIIDALSTASKVIYIIMESLVFDCVLADIDFLCLVDIGCHADGCRDPHRNN